MHRQPLIARLNAYALTHPGEQATTARFVDFVRMEHRCFERDCWTGHITGSAWLVDLAGTHVLLTHHRKLGRWLQLGGHSDGCADTLAVALREAEEESGLAVTALAAEIFDLDVHEIPARKSDPTHNHFDVRFVLQATGGRDFNVSDESLDLAWVPIDRLRDYTDEWSVLRMAEKWLQRSTG